MARRAFACCLTILLSLSAARAQSGIDELGFWAADYAMNLLQKRATGDLVKKFDEVYTVLKNGYFVVRSLVDENYSLHQRYFDELSSVNPIVENYYKVGLTVKVYYDGFIGFKNDIPQMLVELENLDVFSPEELDYIYKVFTGMIEKASRNLKELFMVAVPGQGDLEMMDSERIQTVDRIHAESQAIIGDLKRFQRMIAHTAVNRNPAGPRGLHKLFELATP